DASTWSFNTQSNNAGFVRVFGSAVLPRAMVIDPRGQFLFVTNPVSNTTTALLIDQATGSLVANGVYANGGNSAAIDPAGNFLFTPCGLSCGIATFQISPTGQLHLNSTQPGGSSNISSLVTAVSALPTTISAKATPNPVAYGQPTTLVATVLSSGTPVSTGTVNFFDDATQAQYGTANVVNGTAVVANVLLPAGTHTLVAGYSGGLSSNFGSTATKFLVNVTQAVLTVVPTNVSMNYGDPVPQLTATINGFLNSDTPSIVSGTPALSTVVDSHTPPGIYAISAAQGTLTAPSNYVFVFATGTLTVNAATPVALPVTEQSGLSSGGGPNYTDTHVTPYASSQNGWITSWQMEFSGGQFNNGKPFIPAGVQLKIFRSTSSGLMAVAQGQIHDPRPILLQKFNGPFFTDQASLTTFNEAPIPVVAGDLIGLTIYSDPAAGGYAIPLAGPPGALVTLRNVLIGQSVTPADRNTLAEANPPVLGFTVTPSSGSNPLSLMNNYLVTGDYSTGSVTLRGTGQNGVATGNISIPTAGQDSVNGVPDGADIVGAFLYWETLENTPAPTGNAGTFRGYSISGQQLGKDLQYSDGNFNGTMRAYRADVLPYFAVTNGIRVATGSHTVKLPDGGNALPVTEGATLVVIYRVISPNFPLKAVVLYDGAAAPTTPALQIVQGFYDAASSGGAMQARATNIYTSNSTWSTATSTVPLLSGSQYGANLAPGAWAGIILSTPVNNTDNDGILDAWKTGPPAGDFHAGQPGYYDAKFGQWIPLPGAAHGQKDLFVQMDYMCTVVRSDGTCDTVKGRSELPTVDAQGHDPIPMLQQLYANHGIAAHFMLGNAIQEETCTDAPGQLCQFPGEFGVASWKLGVEIFKVWPKDPVACGSGGDCSPRFRFGAKDSYHYVLMANSVAIPQWNTTWGTLTSIVVNNNVGTITTADRGNGVLACPCRISITGALGNPSLNGVYNVTACGSSTTMTIATSGVPNWTYPNNTMPEPVLGVTSGTISSISGFSDLGGSDTVVSLGKWETAPNQDMSKRVNVQVGTLAHEIGHTLGLTHGGTYYDTPNSYVRTIEANCKPNYQSVMNYMFQIDLLGPNHALELSNQQLPTIDESQAGSVANFGTPIFPTSSWYVPAASNPNVAPATRHCDGSAVVPGTAMFRVDGPVDGSAPLGWTNGQDVNYDGQLNTTMRGFNDWANMDLRQVGATSGDFVELADVLAFGNIGSELNVGAGGNVTLGSGGTVALGSGGNVTMGSGGRATLSSGGTISLGSGGNVTLGSGGTVTLGSGGTIAMGSGGNIILGSGGFILGASGGTITLGSGGNVTLGSGGNVILGGGGTILLGSGGTVVLGAGGNYTLDGSGGTIVLGAGGNVTLGSGGNVTLGSGGTVTLGSGGNITLGSGGTVVMGSGGTITMGSGGNVILGSGGTVTLGSGGTITMGSGGNITLGSGGNVTLGSGGTVTLGSGGDAALAQGGNVTLGSGGSATLGSGGNVTLGSGGTVTLGSGGTITLGSGGNVTLGSGGNVTLGSGGTVALGSGGNITLGSGGTIILGSGGNVTLGSGGNVTLASGGNIVLGAGGSYTGSAGDSIVLGAGGSIVLGSGGTIALGSGGNVTLGSGGTITMGSGGTVTLGSGGTVTLGSGGTIAMGSGGTVTLGSGGNVTLGSGGNVTLGSGGTVALGSGGNVTLGSGGTVTLGSGGNTILGSGGNITLGSGGNVSLGSGGNVTLGSGGTLALGSGGNVTLGSGGNVALGSGGTLALGSGGNIALGSGGTSAVNGEGGAALGSGGVVIDEMSYETANSVVRPPEAPTAAPTLSAAGAPAVQVNWTPPAFGVVTQYTIYRSDNGGTPVAIGTVTGNPPATTFLDTQPSGATKVAYTISTNVTDPNSTTSRQSPPSVPALLTQTINFGPLATAKVGDTVPVTASASSGLPVSFSTSGTCNVMGQATSPTNVNAASQGNCTVTATQGGNNTYAPASVSQSFSIAPSTLRKLNQTISFPPLATHTFGDPDFTLIALASSNLPVSYTASGNCTVSGSMLHLTGAGSCTVTASQSGNNNYNPAANLPQSFSINKGTAAIKVVGYNVSYDGKAHTATGTATGVGGVDLSSELSLTSTTHTPAGNYNDSWTFTDTTGNYNNTSGPVTDVISRTNTMTALTTSPNPSDYNTQVTFSATVTSASGVAVSEGIVAFYSDGSSVPVCSAVALNNQASCQNAVTNPLAPGTHAITASYTDVGNFNGSIAGNQITQVVGKRMTSLTVTFLPANTVPIYSNVTVKVSVRDSDPNGSAIVPTGTITLQSTEVTDMFSSTNCTLDATGTCSVTVSPVVPNGRFLTASYGGDTFHLASDNKTDTTATNLMVTAPVSTSQVCLKAPFNGIPIAAGRYIWFSSVFQPRDDFDRRLTALMHVTFYNQTIQIGSGTPVPVPDAEIIIDPTARSASTSFDTVNNLWQSTLPAGEDDDDKLFLSGLAYPVPSPGLPGNVKPVTWCGYFASDSTKLHMGWQWAAAVYTNFTTNYNAVGVKPIDDADLTNYRNNDKAGTPENYKQYVIGGARGGGGKNYTGGYSGSLDDDHN
ncbi:MAG: Ig-like domain repeat protein, partial [Acidobacteria bacterium]|nr:Ig-like domain repeat protein [Acidobacteriota bacterium]